MTKKRQLSLIVSLCFKSSKVESFRLVSPVKPFMPNVLIPLIDGMLERIPTTPEVIAFNYFLEVCPKK